MIAVKLLFCLMAFAVSLLNAEEDGRIVNGVEISIRQVPYMIQIRSGGHLLCGASLIAPRYVVTAAHCVYDKDVKELVLVSGATTVSEAGLQRKVSRYIIHPDYNPKTMHTDIAVAELNAPIQYIPTLKLCQQPLKEGNYVQVSGWGKMGANMGLSYNLRTVLLPVRSQKTCINEFGRLMKQHMFCTSGLEAIGACRGDSGGPAVYKGQLCGIVAFSAKCGEIGYTDGYTNVYTLRPFIEEFMSGE